MNPISTALTQIRRSPYQSMATILLLTVTFVVAYAFSLFLTGSEIVLRYFEKRPQVIAFFKIETQNEDLNQVAKSMSEKPYVGQIKLVSKDEALEIYKQENQDDPLLLELVTAEILPASIEVSGNSIDDLSSIKKDLDSFDKIDEVVLQQDIIDSLSNWTRVVRMVALSSILVLSIVSFLMMVIVIGMKVVAQRPAIQIMRLIGATKWFIKSPFVFEGIIYALLSSLVAWLISVVILFYLTPYIKDFLGEVASQIFPISPYFFAIQLSMGSLLGILMGAFAGSVSVGRMIKK